jgi:hypothetical protein
VFDVQRKRWVQPEHATPAEVAAQVERCPSAALQYRLLDTDQSASSAPSVSSA